MFRLHTAFLSPSLFRGYSVNGLYKRYAKSPLMRAVIFYEKQYCNVRLRYPLTRAVGNATLRSETRAFGMPQQHGFLQNSFYSGETGVFGQMRVR